MEIDINEDNVYNSNNLNNKNSIKDSNRSPFNNHNNSNLSGNKKESGSNSNLNNSGIQQPGRSAKHSISKNDFSSNVNNINSYLEADLKNKNNTNRLSSVNSNKKFSVSPEVPRRSGGSNNFSNVDLFDNPAVLNKNKE